MSEDIREIIETLSAMNRRWMDADAEADVTKALSRIDRWKAAAQEVYRGHNSRGSDGPCECALCLLVREENTDE